MNADEYFAEVKTILKKYHVKEAVLFGSRAKGTARERSDFDIAVKGAPDMNGLREAIDNINSLYTTDLVNLDRPCSRELREDVEKYGVQI